MKRVALGRHFRSEIGRTTRRFMSTPSGRTFFAIDFFFAGVWPIALGIGHSALIAIKLAGFFAVFGVVVFLNGAFPDSPEMLAIRLHSSSQKRDASIPIGVTLLVDAIVLVLIWAIKLVA